MNWWDLVPDVDQPLVVDGRGTRMTSDDFADVLDNDYVTAARTLDGSLAVVYVPTSRTITLDPDRVAASATAEWVDPAAVDRPRRPARIAADGSVSTPGPNSDGDEDWLLVIMNQP